MSRPDGPADATSPGRREHGRTGMAVVVLVLLPIYLLTMTPADDINVDAEPAAMPAWLLVQHGTLDFSGRDTNGNPFIREAADGRILSNRAVGLWALAVPAYLLTDDPTFSPDPSSVVGVLLTTAAMAAMYLVLRRSGLSDRWSIASTLALGLGTATWPISAAELWPHGPGQLFLALALLASAAQRPLVMGFGLGAAILVRPVTGLFAALATARSALRRKWASVAWLLVPTGAATLTVLLYNRWAYGKPSLSGGYGSGFSDNLTEQSLGGYISNLALVIGSPRNGLLVWSPIVAVCALGLIHSWRSTPRWAREAAVAGLLYMLLHARLNRASGGLPFNYRYPLEALTLCTPALAHGARAMAQRGENARRVLVVGLAASIMVQGLMAVRYDCDDVPGAHDVCSII